MPYFFSRLCLVFLPLAVWQCVELFVLPVNYFTYRAWEAVSVGNRGWFHGPFYPAQDVSMWSAGDLDPRGPRAKFVHFYTDDHGFRNPKDYDPASRYDFLLVGDSHVAGSNIDEKETLRAILESDHGKSAYSYASGFPASMAFSNDDRVRANPPRWVVLEFRPEDVVYGYYTKWPACEPVNASLQARLCERVSPVDRLVFGFASPSTRITLDRATRQLGYNFLRARMGLATRKQPPQLSIPEAEANCHAFVDAILALRTRLASQSVRLIVLVMPLPYPAGVGDWVVRQLEPHVPVVHWQAHSPYASELQLGNWYASNDSHWKESSIRFAAKHIVEASEGN